MTCLEKQKQKKNTHTHTQKKLKKNWYTSVSSDVGETLLTTKCTNIEKLQKLTEEFFLSFSLAQIWLKSDVVLSC